MFQQLLAQLASCGKSFASEVLAISTFFARDPPKNPLRTGPQRLSLAPRGDSVLSRSNMCNNRGHFVHRPFPPPDSQPWAGCDCSARRETRSRTTLESRNIREFLRQFRGVSTHLFFSCWSPLLNYKVTRPRQLNPRSRPFVTCMLETIVEIRQFH